ncbi:MAG: hypothetical protein AAF628_07800 [Planctomycetota bacterium]
MRQRLTALSVLLLLGCSQLPPDVQHKPHPRGTIWRAQQRLDEHGRVAPNALMAAAAQRDAMPALDDPALQLSWTWMGPGNIGGRLRGVLIHPTRPSTMWVGAAGGGVWQTVDAGARWDAVSDFPAALGIGCMAMDPTDPDRLYVGTGEGFFDTPPGSSILAALRGAGIFASSDGGATWNQLPSTASWAFTNRLAIDPTDPRVLLAATGTGIFRSDDGGGSWQRTTTMDTMDVRFHPTDSSRAVAGTGTGMAQYSSDGGRSWNLATGWSRADRVEVRYWRGNPNTVFAAVSNSGRIRVYRSDNGGQQYGLRTLGSGVSTYSRYNSVLWVDPTDDRRLLVGGIRSHRSLDGGANFQQISTGGYYDYHVFVEHPGYNGSSNRTVFSGSDGGIHRLPDMAAGSAVWQGLNNNLGVNQFYGAAINPISGVVFGGTQDQGTLLYNGGTENWTRPVFGDGGFAATDPTDARYFYGESQNMNMFRSSNGGRSTTSISGGIRESSPNFIAPFVLDPGNPRRMFAGGAQLWRTNNCKTGTPSWRSIKPAISCSPAAASPPGGPSHFASDPPCNISAIGVGSMAEGSVVWVGHNNGEIWVTPNGLLASPAWTRVDAAVPDRWIGRIVPDPRDPTRAYVGLMGYSSDNVWLTEDSGQTWRSISGTGALQLPDAPVPGLAVHRTVPGVLFAGTDLGVFCSLDDGGSWQVVPGGPFNVPVEELVWRDDRTLMAVTHGRGIYVADLLGAAATNVGTGCGLAGPPTLAVSAPAAGTTQTYDATGFAAAAAVHLLFGAGPANPLTLSGGCTLQPDLATLVDIPVGTTDASGAWSGAFPVPASAELLGAVLTTQALAVGASGPVFGRGELSQGVEMTFGL